jgi:hypothetical protein
VLQAYEKRRVLPDPLDNITRLARLSGARLHKCERGLLRLLEDKIQS